MTCETTDEFRATVQDFINERKWLKNVSPKTLAWYRDSFKAFEGCETEAAFKKRIGELRGRGVAAVSVNSWLRCINAYLKWKGADYKLPKLKEEQKILATLSPDAIRVTIAHKPSGRNLTRAHLLTLLMLDVGLRANEALSLTTEAINLDLCTLKVKGKGNKERVVPISVELRKLLFKHLQARMEPGEYVFCTRKGTKLTQRNALRDLKVLGKRIGITGVRFSFHTFRHSFSVSYLKNGGNLEYLRRILGHQQLSTTQKYLQSLGVEDLGAVHSTLSPLSRLR